MISPLFDTSGIKKSIRKKIKGIETVVVAILQARGEEFLTECREQDTWEDDTGNLRSSIGYFIFKGRKPIVQAMGGSEAEGQDAGIEIVANIDLQDDSYYLIGVAGMNYAAAVEAKGYNVISTQTLKIIPLIEGDLNKLSQKLAS